MGNTCQAKYRTCADYNSIEEDGSPYYKPRSFDSQITNSESCSPDVDAFDMGIMTPPQRTLKIRQPSKKFKLNLSVWIRCRALFDIYYYTF